MAISLKRQGCRWRTTAALAFIAGLALTSCAALAPVSQLEDLETLSTRINKASLDAPLPVQLVRIEREMVRSHLTDFSAKQLTTWSSRDLRLAIAAYETAVYVSNAALAPQMFPTMERIVSELDRRGEDSSSAVRALHKSYVQSRDFEIARLLSARYPATADLEHVPALASTHLTPERVGVAAPITSQRTVWQWTPEATLRRISVALSSGLAVVAIVAPECHFSARALRAIQTDNELEAMLQNALWLMPPARSLDAVAVRDWNNAHPNYRFDYVHKVSEWPEIEYWDTPQFYFFANGRLVDTVAGWPREGRKDALRLAYAKAKANSQ